MKKLLFGAAILVLCSVTAAEARVNVDVGIGYPGTVYAPAPVYYAPPPPVYYEPRPVYYAPRPVYYGNYPYYRDGYNRHREYDWNYWHGRPGYYR